MPKDIEMMHHRCKAKEHGLGLIKEKKKDIKRNFEQKKSEKIHIKKRPRPRPTRPRFTDTSKQVRMLDCYSCLHVASPELSFASNMDYVDESKFFFSFIMTHLSFLVGYFLLSNRVLMFFFPTLPVESRR